MIIDYEHNAYFIHQNYVVAKTSSPDKKLKSALYLFHFLISESILVVFKFVLFTSPRYHMISS